jgi:hypothetical protein
MTACVVLLYLSVDREKGIAIFNSTLLKAKGRTSEEAASYEGDFTTGRVEPKARIWQGKATAYLSPGVDVIKDSPPRHVLRSCSSCPKKAFHRISGEPVMA